MLLLKTRHKFRLSSSKRNTLRTGALILLGIITISFLLNISIKQQMCWIEHYRSRLFCFVITNEENIKDRGQATYKTWGRRCGRFVFVLRLNSTKTYNKNIDDAEEQLPIEFIETLPSESYSYLSDKVRSSLLYFNEKYPNYDWYLKADDDTYIIVENLLRFLVSTIKRKPKPVLYGYRFREDYYVSGGAGYILTRQGLQLFSSYMKENTMYSQCNSTMEDLMVGTCLKKIFQFAPKHHTKGLTLVGETVDQDGRERFHPLAFRLHFQGPSNKTKREWIHYRPFHHNLFGYEGISETTVSFHYTQPSDMYQIDSILYYIRQFDKQVCQAKV